MAIHCIVGVPGAGKTLYALDYVERKFQGREVWYWNIPGLQLPWREMEDPEKWFTLPEGAVFVIDEAHQVFTKTDGKSTPPDFIRRVDEHRHHGWDFVLITQRPEDLNTFVRARINPHILLERPITNSEKATVYTWARYQSRTDLPDVKERADVLPWAYPKQLYDQYESATLHTVEREIPRGVRRLVALGAACAVILAAVLWGGLSRLGIVGGDDEPAEVAVVDYVSPSPREGLRTLEPERVPEDRRMSWLAERTPRIPWLPSSAPVYDSLTRPRVVPRIAACIATDERCQCWTQQATTLHVPELECREIIAFGRFDDMAERRPPPASEKAYVVVEPKS